MLHLQITAFAVLTLILMVPSRSLAQEWWDAINKPIPPQTGICTIEFDLVPRDTSVFRAHFTLSQIVPGTVLSNGWHDNAIIIRCEPASHLVDCRNGGYEAEEPYEFFTDESYHIKLVISVAEQLCDAYIQALPDGDEVPLAGGYEFRTDAVNAGLADTLKYYNITIPYTDPSTGVTDSGAEVKDFKIYDEEGTLVFEDPGTEYSPEYVDSIYLSSPQLFILEQNYPNPFNPTTTISYELSRPEHVTLKVFSILGQEVVTLVNEVQQGGRHTVTFDASRLSSGVYLYSLSTGSERFTRKMMLLQ